MPFRYLSNSPLAWFVRCTQWKRSHRQECHLYTRGRRWCPLETHRYECSLQIGLYTTLTCSLHRLPPWRSLADCSESQTRRQHGLYLGKLRCVFYPLSVYLCDLFFLSEYIWNYYFYQDGSIELEVRLTGILQVYVAKDGEPNPFGTTIAKNINAQYHQHMFSVRVDPMVDGLGNSVVEADILPLPDAETGSAGNYAGNAFVVKETILKEEGGRQYDYEKERRWRITNPARKHFSTASDVGYVLGMKGGVTPMMARKDGWAGKRAAFVKNSVWVCKDVEGPKGSRMWPSGKYVPGTRDEPEDSVGKWVEGKENIENEDILVYLTVGEYPPCPFFISSFANSYPCI